MFIRCGGGNSLSGGNNILSCGRFNRGDENADRCDETSNPSGENSYLCDGNTIPCDANFILPDENKPLWRKRTGVAKVSNRSQEMNKRKGLKFLEDSPEEFFLLFRG